MHSCYTTSLIDRRAASETQPVWLSRVDALMEAQRKEAREVLSGRSEAAATLAAVEIGVDEERRCPHARRGGQGARAAALFVQKGCGRTFNALTGTPLSRLRHKERWLSFGEALAEGETVKASSERCDVAVTTAFRWHLRRRWRPLQTSSRASSRPTRPGQPQGGAEARSQGAPPESASGALSHIQTVNSRHSQLKDFLRQYRGVATRYLKSYLRWFHLIVPGSEVSPRACLAAAMGGLSIRNAN